MIRVDELLTTVELGKTDLAQREVQSVNIASGEITKVPRIVVFRNAEKVGDNWSLSNYGHVDLQDETQTDLITRAAIKNKTTNGHILKRLIEGQLIYL